MNVNRTHTHVSILAAIVASLTLPAVAHAVTAGVVNAVGIDVNDNLTSLTIDGSAVGLGDLVGTTMELAVSTANTSVRTVVLSGDAAPLTQATAAGHLSDGSFRTGQQVADTSPYQVFGMALDSNIITGTGVDFVMLANTGSPFLSFAPVDAGGTPLGSEAISFDGNALAVDTIVYDFHDITGLDGGTGWATSLIASGVSLPIVRAYALNFSPGIEISAVNVIVVADSNFVGLEAYGITSAAVPAPAALPAGLTLLAGVAMRRRRLPVAR